jgi:hypothetical protein
VLAHVLVGEPDPTSPGPALGNPNPLCLQEAFLNQSLSRASATSQTAPGLHGDLALIVTHDRRRQSACF